MIPQYSYTKNNKLSEILQDPCLQDDKFGAWSSKLVRIQCDGYIYEAGVALLRLLIDRYGDINFEKAYKRWKLAEGKK